jgi:hypothetical protein
MTRQPQQVLCWFLTTILVKMDFLLDDPYYKAYIAPSSKVLNDLKPSKEQLEKVYGGIMKEVNDLRLQIDSKKPFLALIVKAKASILILPKFKPKMCFFGLLKILN